MDFNIILAIVATGIPGLFSYWILTQLDIVFYNNNQNADKSVLLISLSLLNVFIAFISLNLLGITINNISPIKLIVIFIISLVIVCLLSMYIYPFVFKWLQKYMNDKKVKTGLSIKSNYKVLPRILHARPKNKKYTQAYIFDFDNRLIIEGTVGEFSYTSPEISIENTVDTKTTYEQAIRIYGRTDNINRSIYLDYDRNIKIILIHY